MGNRTSISLERGNIYFFYQPKVEEDSPGGLSDIQRFYMILNPEEKERFRLTIIGNKKMPDPSRSGHKRFWGFVDTVRKSPDSLMSQLEGEIYRTKTRGERRLPPGRPAGEGVYRIIRHEDHTHLAYALELPEKPGKPQEQFNIEEEASYIISIKNPESGSPQAAGLAEERKAELPKYLQEKFRGRRFVEADPPEFLDKEGIEFILISASVNIEEELGVTLHPQNEDEHSADIFKTLRLDRSEHPVKPLLQGEWK